MSNREPGAQGAGGAAIAEALDKNQQAAEDVKKAADDLAVVHAVLDTKLAEAGHDHDVERAVAETSRVEKRLSQSADTLDQVNEALKRQVVGGKG